LVEYPGYGLYKGKCCSDNILNDSEIVLEFLVHEVNIPLKNIILFGRSVGTGPATHLAAKYDVGGLILVSPYTSMKKLVGDHFGRLAKWCIAERFENIKEIEFVKCPTFFIHGEKDELIPVKHSIELQQKIKEGVFSELYTSKEMTHNK
jgi:pimeloyl-ACP methyl ester carboxylesterase